MSWSFAGSRIALMFRRLRGRYGISAPQVAVRTHVPWHLRLAVIAGGVTVALALTGWAYDAGRRTAGFDQSETSQVLEELRSSNAALTQEVARLRSLLSASESNLQIEQATQKLLTEKNAVLDEENAKLKEDLAVFERLTKLEGRASEEISLDRLNVHADSPGHYRFSFLIALQGARRGKETKLDLQISVSPRGQDGAKLAFPASKDVGTGQYVIVLRNFRRIEGQFVTPPDFPVGNVEIRIVEAGILKASKSLTL